MQQFTVPQFIDVEDKIIGPITARQFIILLAGFLAMGVFYKIFDFSLFLTTAILTLLISGTFAFLKINGRPFHYFLLNLIQTFKRPGLRVWNNAFRAEVVEDEADEVEAIARIPAAPKLFTSSRLAELSLMVDTKGAYGGAAGEEKIKLQ